jgi:hypothetical protein
VVIIMRIVEVYTPARVFDGKLSHQPTEPMVIDPRPVLVAASKTLYGVGVADAVVMATGYAVELVGSVHVDPERHVAVGAVLAVIETRLPLVANVPMLASEMLPVVVKVVAETVTCQPVVIPVALLTRYVWSAGSASTSVWSTPLTTPAQVRVLGVVMDRVPEVRVSVPVIEQDTPARHVCAPAGPAETRTDAPIPPASSMDVPRMHARRPLAVRIKYLITARSPSGVVTLPERKWHVRIELR